MLRGRECDQADPRDQAALKQGSDYTFDERVLKVSRDRFEGVFGPQDGPVRISEGLKFMGQWQGASAAVQTLPTAVQIEMSHSGGKGAVTADLGEVAYGGQRQARLDAEMPVAFGESPRQALQVRPREGDVSKDEAATEVSDDADASDGLHTDDGTLSDYSLESLYGQERSDDGLRDRVRGFYSGFMDGVVLPRG